MLTYCSINTPTFQITHATRQQRVSETCGTFYYRLIIMEMFVFRVLPCDESCDKWWSKSSHCFLWKGSRPQNKYAVWAVTIWLVRCELGVTVCTHEEETLMTHILSTGNNSSKCSTEKYVSVVFHPYSSFLNPHPSIALG